MRMENQKKGTLVFATLIAFLLVAYLWSYLHLRAYSKDVFRLDSGNLLVTEIELGTAPDSKLNYLYWPLLKLDGLITGHPKAVPMP